MSIVERKVCIYRLYLNTFLLCWNLAKKSASLLHRQRDVIAVTHLVNCLQGNRLPITKESYTHDKNTATINSVRH